MRWRIKKKRGLLHCAQDARLRKRWQWEQDERAAILEQRARAAMKRNSIEDCPLERKYK